MEQISDKKLINWRVYPFFYILYYFVKKKSFCKTFYPNRNCIVTQATTLSSFCSVIGSVARTLVIKLLIIGLIAVMQQHVSQRPAAHVTGIPSEHKRSFIPNAQEAQLTHMTDGSQFRAVPHPAPPRLKESPVLRKTARQHLQSKPQPASQQTPTVRLHVSTCYRQFPPEPTSSQRADSVERRSQNQPCR